MGIRREDGQALLLAIGGAFALIVAALAVVAIAGAVSGKGRVQRAADLAAISAARSMRDDLPRLLAPPTLPNGVPNPVHMEKAAYLLRARIAAGEAGRANGVGPGRLRVSFPDALSFAPVRAKAAVVASVEAERVEASAVAEAAAPGVGAGGGSMPATASGGGYSGRLVYRQGHGMRPDVAAAFDRMAAAAARAGISLIVNSAFRSDAEQAALFAEHPDPRWVAPPGHSLHRCATELDLGPESAYGWLAAHAGDFGFLQRYSWEPWHYGLRLGSITRQQPQLTEVSRQLTSICNQGQFGSEVSAAPCDGEPGGSWRVRRRAAEGRGRAPPLRERSPGCRSPTG